MTNKKEINMNKEIIYKYSKYMINRYININVNDMPDNKVNK